MFTEIERDYVLWGVVPHFFPHLHNFFTHTCGMGCLSPMKSLFHQASTPGGSQRLAGCLKL